MENSLYRATLVVRSMWTNSRALFIIGNSFESGVICVCVCVYIYILICVYIYIHIHIHIYIHTYIYILIYVFILYIYWFICWIFSLSSIYWFIHLLVYLLIHLFIYLFYSFVCVCVRLQYLYKHSYLCRHQRRNTHSAQHVVKLSWKKTSQEKSHTRLDSCRRGAPVNSAGNSMLPHLAESPGSASCALYLMASNYKVFIKQSITYSKEV